jgi:hypothetical protein
MGALDYSERCIANVLRSPREVVAHDTSILWPLRGSVAEAAIPSLPCYPSPAA